ncbi:unnamed protein product [Porites evermanni]|uniref:G-protein coupled receptors family 3 profile domain-containing protein n=1 Tax=Porites evermanni TaxID=104178 RepID=A0ABN8QUU1_9CNID|nr:unnamed protein product [Porites evermanni]
MTESACLYSAKIDDRAFAKLHNAFIPYLTDAVQALAHALDSLLKCKNANVTPEAMPQKLRKVSFQGITGQVQFTKSGDPTYSSYNIVNFQKQAENYENVKVGTWTGANKENEPPISTCSHHCPPGTKQTITVSCCWECIKCPLGSISKQHSSPNCKKCLQLHKSNGDGTACLPLPVINIKWSDVTAEVFLILTVIGLLATGMAIFVFIKNQSTPLVRVSNRELSLLLLVEIALCFVLTLLHLAQPTKTLCCTIYPLRYFINTTFFSILFLKTNRLVRAFQTNIIPNWFKRYIVDRKRQFLVVLGLNVFYTCMPFRSAIGSVLRATMFSYFILLSLVCAGYAFKARRLPENFNETRYIGSAMYVLLISWVSFYLVDTSLEGFYTTIVACATALVTAYGILLCFFAPKLFVILLRQEQNTNEFMKAEIRQFTNSATFSATIQQVDVHPTNGI